MKESSWEDPRGIHSWMLGLHLNSAPTFPGVILFDGFLGCSVHFTPSLGRLRDGLVEAFIIAREQRVPEMYIWVNEVRPFRSGYLCSGATFLCMVHSTFCQFSFCLESLILIDCLLICWGFCKMCHFLTPYLLVWHLIGLKGCGLRNPAKSCQEVRQLELSRSICCTLFLLVRCGWPATSCF